MCTSSSVNDFVGNNCFSSDPTYIDDATDRLVCLIEQEEKHYTFPDYLSSSSSSGISSSLQSRDIESNRKKYAISSSKSSTSVVEECARLVTDLSQQPNETQIKNSKSINKTPSINSVQDLLKKQSVSSCVSSSRQGPTGNNDDTTDTVVEAHCTGLRRWRKCMFDWAKSVVDALGVDHEVIAVAFNILDRYVAKEIITARTQITKENFQLFAMTSLYIAVKTLQSHPQLLSVGCLVDMSRGFYTAAIICETEYKILQGIGWFVNPPTACTFYKVYCSLLPSAISKPIEVKCASLVELAISDNFLCAQKSSVIGIAAVLLAAHSSDIKSSSDILTPTFFTHLPNITKVPNNQEVDECYCRLKELYYSSEFLQIERGYLA